MKIGIIGSGRIGGALGKIWAAGGHQIMFSGSRDEQKLQALAQSAGVNASTGSPAQAAQFGDVVLLAVPWHQVDNALAKLNEVIASVGSLEGKILIDATNPLNPESTILEIGWSNSGGEEVARRAKGAKVVKAYNTVGANILESESRKFGDVTPVLFFCGDDAQSKSVVAMLIADSGFEPLDVGGIQTSRFLEPMEQLWVEIAKSGIGQEFEGATSTMKAS
jgi:hypothetical protein